MIARCSFSTIKNIKDDSTSVKACRTYVLCPGMIQIGTKDLNHPHAISGDMLLLLFNLNVEIKCETPGTCFLAGGASQVISADHSMWVYSLFKLQPNIPAPTFEEFDFIPDTSNLILDGLTFTESGNINNFTHHT